MYKRLSIVIVVFLGVVFVPYFLGKINPLDLNFIKITPYWVIGFVYVGCLICIAVVLCILIFGLKLAINYIKNGI